MLAERAVGTRTLESVPELPALRYARGLRIVPPDAHLRRAGLDIVGQHRRFACEMFPWTDVTPAARTVMHRDASRPRGMLWQETLDDGDCASKHRARRWGGKQRPQVRQSCDQRESECDQRGHRGGTGEKMARQRGQSVERS